MALLKYFSPSLPKQVLSLTEKEVEEATSGIRQALKDAESKGCGKYNDFTVKERAQIGKYATEHGPARAVRHCSKLLGRQVPETTARRLKSEYLQALKRKERECADDHAVVQSLPTKPQGRPLLLRPELDKSIQDNITAM